MWRALIEALRVWLSRRREHIPVPDLRQIRLEDALREVKIETAKQKAAELKAANERAARESSLPPTATP